MTGFDVGPGACDCHLHFYDDRFEAAATATLFPANASPVDYRSLQAALGLERLVIVQPTTYGLDNSCQIEALAEFGDSARGIAVIDSATTTDTIEELHAAGMRGARFQMLPGGAIGWEHLAPVARHIEPFGWHIQLQLNGREFADRLGELRHLPTPLVVDHIGRFMPPVTRDHDAFQALRRLLDDGRTWVKLSAPYESALDHAATLPLADALVTDYPERLLWGSNWPHPGQQAPPDLDELRELALRWLPTPELRRRVLVDNPAQVYGFGAPEEER